MTRPSPRRTASGPTSASWMPGSTGSRCSSAGMTAESPAPRVVVTAVTRDEDDLVAAFRAGASGYLPKDVRARRLRDALAAVAAGATMLPPTLASRVLGTSDAR